MSINQEIKYENKNNISLFIKREDLLHPFVSGNKFRKLKYNLLEATKLNKSGLLTFGGAFSNHIAAVAFAGKEQGFKTIGIIRGEELVDKIEQNPTLRFAQSCGMHLEFVSRADYRLKTDADFLAQLSQKYSDCYVIPEGGTNELAVKGCEEILTFEDKNNFDYICTAVGTGGTISGIINSSAEGQKVLGFSALKGNFLKDDINKMTHKTNWDLINETEFGGYAKFDSRLITFINDFKQKYNIPLDPIYTVKMVFGIFRLIEENYFPKNSRILMIHTGGLQGIEGFNERLKSKGLSIEI